jgi:hypothetical protein
MGRYSPRLYPKSRNLRTVFRMLKVTRGIPGGWPLFESQILDVSPNMTKVVAVGIIHLPPTPHPPSSAGASPAPGTRGDSTSQSPQAQPHAPGYPPKAENRMIVYDMITKQTIACVSLKLSSIVTSDALSVDRSLKLDGETTSVRVSYDSRYALINHAPDVCFHISLPPHTPVNLRGIAVGNASLGSRSITDSLQIHGTEAGKTRYQELFRRSGWKLCGEWL